MKLLNFALVVVLVLALIPLSKVITPVDATIPVTLGPIADAYVDSSNPDSNFGISEYLYATFRDYNYTDDVRTNSYLMFNLGSFSSGEVASASLRLYAWHVTSPTPHVGVHQCSNTTWNENTIYWLDAPSFSPLAIDSVAVPLQDQWYSWNVTEPVNSAAGSKLTLVLSVEDINEHYDAYFYSRDGWYSPELVIELKDVAPPTFANFHQSTAYVKSNSSFYLSVDIYDPSGISDAQALFFDGQLNDGGNVSLIGTGENGTYSAYTYFGPAATEDTYTIKIHAVDGEGNSGLSDTLGTITLDNTLPNITDVTQNPSQNAVSAEDHVEINATVGDTTSGIGQVELSYTVNETAHFTINMTNLQGPIFNATIPTLPYGTNVTYVIVAVDNANNTRTTQEMGLSYEYTVVPEITPFLILPLFMILTLLSVILHEALAFSREPRQSERSYSEKESNHDS
jgi:hypothetical protein